MLAMNFYWVLSYCVFILLHAASVKAQEVALVWTLNRTSTVNISSAGSPLYDERSGLIVYGFSSQADGGDSPDDGNSGSSGTVYPCFVASNDTTARVLSSAIFALCMRPPVSTFFSSMDSPFQGPAILWAANRGSPARGGSLSVTLMSDGDLVFYNDGKIELPVWSAGTSGRGVVRMEITENPANLKLVDLRNRTVWQSLDYPFDSLSIGQSLTVGRKLVSWASGADFSEGMFSLVVEPNYQLKLLYRMEAANSSADYMPYWTWQPGSNVIPSACRNLDVNSIAFSSCLNETRATDASSGYQAFISADGFSVASKINGTTLSDTVLSSQMSENELQTSILRLDFDGGLRLYSIGSTWLNVGDLFANDTCLLPTRCGSFGVCSSNGQCMCPDVDADHADGIFVPFNSSDPSQGCLLAQPPLPNCSVSANQSSDRSLQMRPLKGGIDYFANKYSNPVVVQSTDTIQRATETVCTDLCLLNCSCSVAFWHEDSGACFHAQPPIGSFRGALNSSNYKAYVKVRSTPLALPPVTNLESSRSGRNRFEPVAKGLGFGLAGFLLVSVMLAVMHRRGYTCVLGKWGRKRERLDKTNADVLDAHMFPELPVRFSYKELDAMTNGFSHKLGKGGFGAVYLGTLPDGSRVAVKKLEGFRQGDKEFWSELVIMGGVHHYNLLQLMGFCVEEEKRLLLYKYMENGSLDQWLFGSNNSYEANSLQQAGDHQHVSGLSWEVRYGVAIGVARGLAYLHEGCRKHILHLDIKPQNILLDHNFVAKVADFGLSRPMERDESHVVTTMRGTPGYLAPEWLKEGGVVGVKCDVFSYGMLLMEIVSGRKNMDQRLSMASYPEWAFSWLADMKPSVNGASVVPMGAPKEQSIDALTNAKLYTSEDREQLRRLIFTAFMCILEKPEWRPSMGRVVQMLEGHVSVADIDLSALRPGLTFVLGRDSSADLSNFQQQLLLISSRSGTSTSEVDESFVYVSAR